MPTSLSACAKLLAAAGIRHHVDAEEAAIRVVFLTHHYTNPRGEKLAIARIETPDEGRRLRASIARAFPVDGNPAAACLALCRLVAETPLVGVAYDAATEGMEMVVESAVEDGRLTKSQVLAMLDGLVNAAEAWHASLHRGRAGGRRRPPHRKPRAA